MKIREESHYFHPRPFVGNNIEYRIGCSAALARFKDSQSFILGQLAFNPFHTFSATAKEILLFKFDVWFDLLCEMEQYLLVRQNNMKYEDLLEMSEERQMYAYKTLLGAEIIDQEFFKRYLEIMEPLKTYHENILKDLMTTDLNPASIFGATVDLAVRALNHILYVIQELDVVLYSENTPIINLDVLSCEITDPITSETYCPATERLKVYRSMRDFDEIIIKDYIEIGKPFALSTFHEELEELGIKYKLI
jgi:hypothetical protein